MIQQTLFDLPTSTPNFDGETFDKKLDGPRLTSQLETVREYMLAIFPNWKTLYEIQIAIRQLYDVTYPIQSISARLRDLKKQKFGGYKVERKRRSITVWEYLVYKDEKC